MPKNDDVTWGSEELGKLDGGNGNWIIVQKRWNDKGWSGLDVRKHYENDNGQIVPTKKGITLRQTEWQDVIAILNDSLGGSGDSEF
jgi:hypothetical protein